jgi:hypothetical protein
MRERVSSDRQLSKSVVLSHQFPASHRIIHGENNNQQPILSKSVDFLSSTGLRLNTLQELLGVWDQPSYESRRTPRRPTW